MLINVMLIKKKTCIHKQHLSKSAVFTQSSSSVKYRNNRSMGYRHEISPLDFCAPVDDMHYMLFFLIRKLVKVLVQDFLKNFRKFQYKIFLRTFLILLTFYCFEDNEGKQHRRLKLLNILLKLLLKIIFHRNDFNIINLIRVQYRYEQFNTIQRHLL